MNSQLNEWSEDIQKRLLKSQENFVAIGYRLRQIRDAGDYDGMESLYDYARREFGMDRTAVSRFISINERYSIGGNSLELDDKYKIYKYSQLSEMLTLPDKELEYLDSSSTVRDIRELKRYAAEEEERKDGVQIDFFQPEQEKPTQYQMVRDFFRSKRTEWAKCISTWQQEGTGKDFAEILAPSGSRMHRKGLSLMLMRDYSNGITIRRMGEPDIKMTWENFMEYFHSLFQGMDHIPCYEEIYPEDIPEYVGSLIKTGQSGISTPEKEQEEEKEGEKAEEKAVKPAQRLIGEAFEDKKEEKAAIVETDLPKCQSNEYLTNTEPVLNPEPEKTEPKEETKTDTKQQKTVVNDKKEKFLELTRVDRESYADALQFIEMDSACFLDGKNVGMELLERHQMKLEQMQEELKRMQRDWRIVYGD